MKALTSIGATGLAFALTACSTPPVLTPIPPPVLYDDASKMNRIDIGMTVEQVQAVLGAPRTSLANIYGFRCAEYGLLKHSSNFVNRHPDTFYVMHHKGKVVDMGQSPCSLEMSEMYFRQDKYYTGKYAKFISQ